MIIDKSVAYRRLPVEESHAELRCRACGYVVPRRAVSAGIRLTPDGVCASCLSDVALGLWPVRSESVASGAA